MAVNGDFTDPNSTSYTEYVLKQVGHAQVKVKFPVFAIFSLCFLSAKMPHFNL